MSESCEAVNTAPSALVTNLPQRRSPVQDGEVGVYRPVPAPEELVPPEVFRRHSDVVIYINGMNTTGEVHRHTAEAIASAIRSTIGGIYNRTDGAARDLLQCKEDFNFYYDKNGISLSGRTESLHWREMHRRYGVAHNALAKNRAAQVLFEQLYQLRHQRKMVRVVAHSQGNLITRNAVYAMLYVTGNTQQQLKVYSLASPANVWPKGKFALMEYRDSADPVTWLQGIRGKIGWGEALAAGAIVGGAFVAGPVVGTVVLGVELYSAKQAVDKHHDVGHYLAESAFLNDLRRDLGMPPLPRVKKYVGKKPQEVKRVRHHAMGGR